MTGNFVSQDRPCLRPDDLTSCVVAAANLCNGAIARPNLFFLAVHPDDKATLSLIERLQGQLSEAYPTSLHTVHARIPRFSADDIAVLCMVIDSNQSESVRDIIKEALWQSGGKDSPARSYNEIAATSDDYHPAMPDVMRSGLYVPYRVSPQKSDILTKSFSHKPVFYRYRASKAKTAGLPLALKDFLLNVSADCPNHLFNAGTLRASAQTLHSLPLFALAQHTAPHQMTILALESMTHVEYKSRHENIEKYLLLNDLRTVACEVPVWLEADELTDFSRIFQANGALTGHIDILRFSENNAIEIWDYKPQAAQFPNAAVQCFLYALMLSVRTGIKLSNFQCGYFDEADAFHFNAAAVRI